MSTGSVRCWGSNTFGQLGYGELGDVGDNETPFEAGDVPVGEPVQELAAGGFHTCAVLSGGRLRCWGRNDDGQLGYSSVDNIGDNETPAAFNTDVSVGGSVVEVVAGDEFTCALLNGGEVRCWGRNSHGQLGNAVINDVVGDNEAPSSRPAISLGADAITLSAGTNHLCAVLEGAIVRCWGNNSGGAGLGIQQLGDVGDNEVPTDAPLTQVGGSVADLAVGGSVSCARLANGAVRCWGPNAVGTLGYGHTTTIGLNEPPSSAGDAPIGGTAESLVRGNGSSCVLLSGGDVRCWGDRNLTGYGDGNTIGDNDTPDEYPPLPFDQPVARMLENSGSSNHMCVIVQSGGVRCWGTDTVGQLGYGTVEPIGDDEAVQNVDVQVLDP